MAKLFETTIAGYTISLKRVSKLPRGRQGQFTVQYGRQVYSNLSREQAQAELAACIFHALECEGKLDP